MEGVRRRRVRVRGGIHGGGEARGRGGGRGRGRPEARGKCAQRILVYSFYKSVSFCKLSEVFC